MESLAKARYVRQSATKVRKMLDLVRGERVGSALNVLHFSPQKASKVIENTIHSAVANMLQTEEGKSVDPENLLVKKAYVDEGPTMRRFRAGAMGRVKRIRKRSSHLTIVLSDEKS